jgi:hypothetical protein
MYNIFNLLCVGLLCVVYYIKPLYCVCVESCHSNQIVYVYNYLCYFMYMFILSQRLMVLYMSFFLFCGYSYSYHVIHMSYTKMKSIMSRKKPKNLYFTVFFDSLPAHHRNFLFLRVTCHSAALLSRGVTRAERVLSTGVHSSHFIFCVFG